MSTSLDATIPRTPLCHPSPAKTRVLRPLNPSVVLIKPSICSRISFSTFCRWLFIAFASNAKFLAMCGSLTVSILSPISGSPILPGAFRRGASLKAKSSAVISEVPILATSFIAFIPGHRVLATMPSPLFTRMRFCPRRGTLSATVPRATRSRYSFKSGSGFDLNQPLSRKLARMATARKNATPTPARSLNGKRQPPWWGLMTGQFT